MIKPLAEGLFFGRWRLILWQQFRFNPARLALIKRFTGGAFVAENSALAHIAKGAANKV